MRTATKYFMDEEQAAIVRVIRSRWFKFDIGEAIANLYFIAGFPEHFKKADAQTAFDLACSTGSYPSTEDLELLMDYPHLLVAMMKYREGKSNPTGAVWNPKPLLLPSFSGATPNNIITPMNRWLNHELDSLGLNK